MNKEKKLFFVVLTGKLVLLAAFLLIFGGDRLIWSDSATYLEIGKNVFSGNGFAVTPENPNFIRTPIYPVIAGFFATFIPFGLVMLSVIQTIISGFTAMLVYRISRYFVKDFLSTIIALLFAFEPLSFLLHILILPEAFLMFFILLFVYLFIRYLDQGQLRDLLLAAAALGLAALAKPIAMYIFIIPFLILLYKTKTKHAFIFLFILFLVVSPWMLRNQIVGGSFVISKDDAGNLCGYELPAVFATEFKGDSSNWNTVWAHPDFLEAKSRCISTTSAIKILVFEHFGAFMKTNALSTLAMLTNEGYAQFFEPSGGSQVKIHNNYLTPAVLVISDWKTKISDAFSELNKAQQFAVVGGKLFWLLISSFAIFGALVAVIRNKSIYPLLLILITIYFIASTVVSTGFGVGARLRHPITPFLFIFASVGFTLTLSYIRKYIHVKKSF